MEYTYLCEVSELPDGERKLTKIEHYEVMVFYYEGKYSAMRNHCLHRGGPVCLGNIQVINGDNYIICPWHGWHYNLLSGATLVPGGAASYV